MSNQTKLQIARDAWGNDLPDWIAALAKACDETSQNKVAAQLSVSAPAVSQVIKGTYAASTKNIETRVRGALLSETVNCPFLGVIGLDACSIWRKRHRDGVRANTLQIQMSRACGRCEVFKDQPTKTTD